MAEDPRDRWRAIYERPPPSGAIKRAPFPPAPNLHSEVTFAPHVCRDDAKVAYRLWSLPDGELGATMDDQARFLDPVSDEETAAMPMHVLAKNVYDHLMRDNLMPPTDGEWEAKWRATGLDRRSWSYREILDDLRGDRTKVVRVHGYDVLTSTYWTVIQLREELERRGVPSRGLNSRELRERLYYHERYSFLRRSDLSHWGITRGAGARYTIRLEDGNNKRYNCLEMYTCAIILSPYNPAYWLSRAYCHYQQAFFDLAIGDAYRAQLLYEVLFDPLLRNRQSKLYTSIWHAIEEHITVAAMGNDERDVDALEMMRRGNGVNSFIPTLRKAAQNITNLSLLALQDWNDHKIMENNLRQKAIMPARDSEPFTNRLLIVKQQCLDDIRERKKGAGPFLFHETNSGSIPGGRRYPFELDDKSRYDDEFVDRLSQHLFAGNNRPIWTSCKIDKRMFPDDATTTDDQDQDQDQKPGLGVFAAEDIPSRGLIFAEEPSMRGHVHCSRLYGKEPPLEYDDTRCENCRKDIPPDTMDRYDEIKNQLTGDDHPEGCKCADAEMTVYFCPAQILEDGQLSCAQIARQLYHFGACGKSWGWLHDAMRPCTSVYLTDGKYHFSHTNEDHGTLLSLLLREVFDVTLHRRGQNPHLMAHEIDELLVLEDHHDWDSRSFPFTLAANIQVPFNILMQLGVDIFRDLSFDTWVIQTVLRKLLVNALPWDRSLRGTNKPYRDKTLPSSGVQHRWTAEPERFVPYDPDFKNLYLFPGFSMFNHACGDKSNAAWAYDRQVPNRVMVWATKNIKQGEEILLSYLDGPKPPVRSLTRVLGKPCVCGAAHDDNGTYASRDPPPVPPHINPTLAPHPAKTLIPAKAAHPIKAANPTKAVHPTKGPHPHKAIRPPRAKALTADELLYIEERRRRSERQRNRENRAEEEDDISHGDDPDEGEISQEDDTGEGEIPQGDGIGEEQHNGQADGQAKRKRTKGNSPASGRRPRRKVARR
ncbi:uncharacterized protein BDW47DRAFT_108193 [Aspergillus candidus]|uniref:Histone-lysine N-methyltransferase SET5 n=1 Tax=Aspergillus candidus TaxID=41067 RepID=A0A2I2F7Q0_ASPCN|nr:hypothetical protein BDW47DRAFT_108193 [Aspergillus candidus]PLB36638.1 hypothetical protein BDW47DRAFT_108193 [Aspergillus candidus]